MRLFIAVDFNGIKDHFFELQQQLPKIAKLSTAKSFHITLKFLGDVQPDNAEEIINKLRTIKFLPFTVFLDSIGVFPGEDHIRVVWVGIKPETQILGLQKQIDEVLIKLFKKEKDFKAHITIARIKYMEDKKAFLQQLKTIDVGGRKVEINAFRLVKSTLKPKGPVYEDLAVFNSI